MKRLILFAMVCLMLPQDTSARTWRVLKDGGGDAATIQFGIDSSSDGDTVLVAPGHYFENLDFLGKEIVVRSAGGPTTTTIDGGGTACVLFKNGEGSSTTIEGFTLTGGVTQPAIGIIESQPSILGNVISGNHGRTEGAGIYCVANNGDWSPVIKENILTDNSVTASGGAIGVYGWIAAIIEDNSMALVPTGAVS